MSRKPTGPGRGGDAVETVFTAISCQSSTASARAICHQLTAANMMTGTVVTLLSNLFERMRDMAFSPPAAVLLRQPPHFFILDRHPRAHPPMLWCFAGLGIQERAFGSQTDVGAVSHELMMGRFSHGDV